MGHSTLLQKVRKGFLEEEPRTISETELGKSGEECQEDEIACSKAGGGVVYSVWLKHREQARNGKCVLGLVNSHANTKTDNTHSAQNKNLPGP